MRSGVIDLIFTQLSVPNEQNMSNRQRIHPGLKCDYSLIQQIEKQTSKTNLQWHQI